MKTSKKFLTPLTAGTTFLHAYYKRFSQLLIEESANLFSLYKTKTNSPARTLTSSPNIMRDTIRNCLPFRMFKTVFNKLHEHSHTGIKITYIFTIFHILKSGSPFSYMTVLNIIAINLSGLDQIKFLTDYLTLRMISSHNMALQYMFTEITYSLII